MVKDIIDSKIAEAMKNREMQRLDALRMIKATLVKAEKDGTVLTEATESKILQKMVKQSEDAIAQFKSGGRENLAEKESADLEVIKEFAPAEVSDADIEKLANTVCKNLVDSGETITMASMKKVMGIVAETYPTASGKIISQVVRTWCK